MGCKVILIRHGLTYWNARKMMQGQVNIPLNDVGVRQARGLARQISPFPLDVCYASPLGRSLKTAQLECFDRGCRHFAVLAQPSRLAQPGKIPLHDPALGRRLEPCRP